MATRDRKKFTMLKPVKNPQSFMHKSGLLFEINRTVLHHLGLALAMIDNKESPLNKDICLVQVVTVRNDPEGWCFAPQTFKDAEKRLKKYMAKQTKRLATRKKALGYIRQTKPGKELPGL